MGRFNWIGSSVRILEQKSNNNNNNNNKNNNNNNNKIKIIKGKRDPIKLIQNQHVLRLRELNGFSTTATTTLFITLRNYNFTSNIQ